MTRTKSAKEYFECDRRFWDILFEKAHRPILWEVFRQLDDRLTRYNPLVLKLFPDSATRPRQREVLMPEKPYCWALAVECGMGQIPCRPAC
jgi:hypothetical protein